MSRDSYDRYMGRCSDELASALISFAGAKPGMRALDVGCGPGALTEVLAHRLGAENVADADPSQLVMNFLPDADAGLVEMTRVAPLLCAVAEQHDMSEGPWGTGEK